MVVVSYKTHGLKLIVIIDIAIPSFSQYIYGITDFNEKYNIVCDMILPASKKNNSTCSRSGGMRVLVEFIRE